MARVVVLQMLSQERLCQINLKFKMEYVIKIVSERKIMFLSSNYLTSFADLANSFDRILDLVLTQHSLF